MRRARSAELIRCAHHRDRHATGHGEVKLVQDSLAVKSYCDLAEADLSLTGGSFSSP